MQNEFTKREEMRESMQAGTDRLLASLKLSRKDFGGARDSEILFALAAQFTAEGKSAGAVLNTLKLANTALELEAVTKESLDGFVSSHFARIDAEREVGAEAQKLAASWQPKACVCGTCQPCIDSLNAMTAGSWRTDTPVAREAMRYANAGW